VLLEHLRRDSIRSRTTGRSHPPGANRRGPSSVAHPSSSRVDTPCRSSVSISGI
jgi:hypothetical protein